MPFFQQHPIYGAKHLDLLDFGRGLDIVNNKGHLTHEGLNELKQIALGMKELKLLKIKLLKNVG